MASITLTPAKTELVWLDSGTIQIRIVLSGTVTASTSLSIDINGNITNSQGVAVGSLTGAQLTALQNLGGKVDSIISAADAAGKLTF